MDSRFTAVIEILSKQRLAYDEMLALAREKTEILAQRSVEELDELVRREHGVLLKLENIEKKRGEAVRALAGAVGKSAEELTFSAIIELMPEEQRHGPAEIYSAMSKTLKELRECNENNKRMIELNLDSINYVLGHVTRKGPQQHNYGGSGARLDDEMPAGPSFLDSKA